jgi:hypothetical protein
MIAQVLDRIIAFAARDEAETVRAREEWAERSGRVFHDDPLYEERTVAFLEWFALDRPGPDGRRPAQRFLVEERPEGLDADQARALAHSHRSLFEVRALGDGFIVVEDLLGGAPFEVTERRRLPGVAEGEVFEARLTASVSATPALLFTRAFQFHPREAHAQLRKLAQAARESGESREAALFRMLRLRLKALRYGHVGADKIYADGDAAP